MQKFNIALCGIGDVTLRLLDSFRLIPEMHVTGIIPDKSIENAKLKHYCEAAQGVPFLDFSDLEELQIDGVVVVEYRKIIPAQYVKKYSFFNCHAGILPKYRGFGANAWAIINGEKEIGYTIHAMNEKFDDGPIYFTKKIKIGHLQTYADVHDEMIDSMVQEMPRVIRDILCGRLEGVLQEGERVYCHRFRKEMGCIADFNVTSEYLFNLYRCMAKPLGTGMYLVFQGERYNVGRLVLGREKNICDYIGIPGKVVNIEDTELWVKTKDNVIVLDGLTDGGGRLVHVGEKFRIGMQLMTR